MKRKKNTCEEDTACDYQDEFYIDDIAAAGRNGKFGYISREGEQLTPLKYDKALPFSRGVGRVRLNGKWGCIDLHGNETVPLKYDDIRISQSENPYVSAKLKGKWGFIDSRGVNITSFEYDDVGAFHDGYACVKKNGRYGFIDRKGVAVIPAIYRDCQPYVTKKYPCRFDCEAEFFPVLVKVKSKYGFVDIHGKEVIAPVYADALPFCGDTTAAILGGKAGFIDETGKVVIPFMYEPDFSEIFNYRFLGDDPANVKLNGKWGAVNRNNNTVLPFLYDEFLLNHNAGWRLAMRDGRKVSVDRMGVERLLQKNPDAPTFKDFLKNVTWQEVKPYFLAMDVALYQTEESLSIFETNFYNFKSKRPQPSQDILRIFAHRPERRGSALYCAEAGDSTLFLPWAEILDMEVRIEDGLTLSDAEVVAIGILEATDDCPETEDRYWGS